MNGEEPGEKAVFAGKDTMKTVICDVHNITHLEKYTVMTAQSLIIQ